MAEIGSVITQVGSSQNNVFRIPTDESVGGILFDISGFESPFNGFQQIGDNFSKGQVRLINNMYEAELLGLGDNGFLNGMVYYHLSMFYNYIGNEAPLYIAFSDCSEDWSFIETMQRECNGKMFQLGVWTSQQVWSQDNYGDLIFTDLVRDIELSVEEFTGKVGRPSASPIPLNIILSPNTFLINGKTVSLKDLPDAHQCNAPKISVLICQNNDSKVLGMQEKNPLTAPVGCVGLMMAVLHLAGAEECVGAVNKFNLNKNDDFHNPEIPVSGAHNLLESTSFFSLSRLASCGYIIPITYEAKEGEYYFNGDSTLSAGDYGTIANNRVMHKCKRCVFTALLPYINSDQLYDGVGKGLSSSAIQEIEEAIGSELSGKMVNKDGQYQINGYRIEVGDGNDILSTDALSVSYSVGPVNYNSTITDSVISQ